MNKIKWKTKEEIERKIQEEATKKAEKERFKGRDTTKLTPKEKDDLLIQMATDLGYL